MEHEEYEDMSIYEDRPHWSEYPDDNDIVRED